MIDLNTLSPIVLSALNNSTVMTETKEFFSGTVLRGVLAARYIEQQELGHEAHRDETFRRLFFGQIRFIDAYPVCQGQRSMVLPLSLQRSKEDGSLRDLMLDEAKAGYKTVKGLGIIHNGAVCKMEVRRKVSLHMSRSAESERITGRSLDGGIYNYEAIEPGQVFRGALIGEASDLAQLLEGLQLDDRSLDCYIGRSRYTEYGHCRLDFQAAGALTDKQRLFGPSVFLRLDTPLLAWNGQAEQAEDVLRLVIDQLQSNERFKGSRFTLGKVIATGFSQENFVGIWNMKRPVRYGLAAGSVFELEKDPAWTEDDRESLIQEIHQGFGAATEEGFGQLRIWAGRKTESEEPIVPEAVAGALGRKRVESEEVRNIAQAILRKRIMELVRVNAYRDTEKLGSRLRGTTHAFARLESMLGERKELETARSRFQAQLGAELRARSSLERHLKHVVLNGKSLAEMLLGQADLPYRSIDYSHEIDAELAEDVGFKQPQDGELFYEYCLWFFRHARKQATSKEEK